MGARVGAGAGGGTGAGGGGGLATGGSVGAGTGIGASSGGTRAADGTGAVADTAAVSVPHDLQNLAVLLLTVPHLIQVGLLTSVGGDVSVATANKLRPQFLQNFAIGLFSAAHSGQITVMFSLSSMFLWVSLRKGFMPFAYFLKITKGPACYRFFRS